MKAWREGALYAKPGRDARARLVSAFAASRRLVLARGGRCPRAQPARSPSGPMRLAPPR